MARSGKLQAICVRLAGKTRRTPQYDSEETLPYMGTTVHSSATVGTPAAFTKVTGQHNVPCRCCHELQDYTNPLWEFRNGDWFCEPCTELALILLGAGQDRSSLVFAYLINPLITKNGFDL